VTVDPASVASDLEYIRGVMARARRRVDPHAFHFVHWGALVLVWYPLVNLLERTGHRGWMLPVGIAALVLGTLLSAVREMRLARRPRLPGEDSWIGNQVGWIVGGSLGAAAILSAAGPATRFIDGHDVPVIWGLAYAAMAWGVGVVYSPEYRWAALFIFAGALAAMIVPEWNGVILGPAMGLGMIVPGVMAERRVRALAAEPGPDAGNG
jgi:hypothetical protein